MYERVLKQKPKDKNKIYSLHEPDVYCMAKGKDHKQYKYGNKVSIASTAKGNIIVGVRDNWRPYKRTDVSVRLEFKKMVHRLLSFIFLLQKSINE